MTQPLIRVPEPDPNFVGPQSWLNYLNDGSSICFYEDVHYYLSNFSAFALVLGGELWMTVEHAYQGLKFDPKRYSAIRSQIKDALSAHEAKKLAYLCKDCIRPDWEAVKLDIMRGLIHAKIQQHPYVQKKLLQTGDAVLIENSHRDSFWGRGPDWQGMNHLGRIWMELRGELRKMK